MEPLLWLVLEAAVALALLVLIVWWTWPRRNTDQKSEPGDEP